MSATPRRVTTDTWAANVAEMIGMVITSDDPVRRAQILAEAQPQLAWALRSAVDECVDAGQPWTQIGKRLDMPRETLYRQYEGGGPIVTVRGERAKPGGAAPAEPEPRDAIFAFQGENTDDRWLGSPDLLPAGEFTTGMLAFAPANAGNQFAGQTLRVRFGPCSRDVSFMAAQVRLADGSERRISVTHEVVNLLFEDGQTPLRRAMVQVINAIVNNPELPSEFKGLVYEAETALVQSAPEVGAMPTSEFIDAVRAVVAAIERFQDAFDIYSSLAMWRLKNVVADYEWWHQGAK